MGGQRTRPLVDPQRSTKPLRAFSRARRSRTRCRTSASLCSPMARAFEQERPSSSDSSAFTSSRAKPSACALDEAQSAECLGRITPDAAGRALGHRQQSPTVVVPNRLHVLFPGCRQLSDGHVSHGGLDSVRRYVLIVWSISSVWKCRVLRGVAPCHATTTLLSSVQEPPP